MAQTMQETLRLYPPVGAGQVRLVNRQLKLSEDLLVPSGCLLWVPHHGVFTSSRNWDRSKEFVPGKTQPTSPACSEHHGGNDTRRDFLGCVLHVRWLGR